MLALVLHHMLHVQWKWVQMLVVNTAIAASQQPVEMAIAFKLAVEAGRMAYLAGLAGQVSHAVASSPLTSFLDE